METKIQRMKELIPVLKEAGKAYYQESREIYEQFLNMTGSMMS